MDVSVITLLCTFFVATRCLPAYTLSQEATQSRIVNGYVVDITEVPYQAALRRKVSSGWAHHCGATVIGSKSLLTAAHCVTSYIADPSILSVTVGTSYRLSGGKSYDLKRIVMHESYSSSTLENDIALLVTRSEISFSKSVKAINIASKNYNLPNGTEALVTGFGAVSYQGAASDVLLAAKVNIVSKESCTRSYLGIASITNEMLCAIATNPPRDACQGDSGGPLARNNTLIGIVSWGEKCAYQSYPGVYTKVSEYESWIVSRVNTYG